ncbi:hypothetical protein D3C78_1645290 [compost metagenome]
MWRHVLPIRSRLVGDGPGGLQARFGRQLLRQLHDQFVERLGVQRREIEQRLVLQDQRCVQAEINAALFRRGLLLLAESPVVVGRQQLCLRLCFREFDIPDQLLSIRCRGGYLAGGVFLL